MDIKDFKSQCEVLTKDCIHHLPSIVKSEDIYFDKENLRVAQKTTFDTEQYLANRINEGLRTSSVKWDINIDKYRVLNDFELSDEQVKTLKYVCDNQVVVMNGFAGSGKSSSSKALINMLDANNKSFKLFVPTGRAPRFWQTIRENRHLQSTKD